MTQLWPPSLYRYPTFTEYLCDDHPRLGWLEQRAYNDHIYTHPDWRGSAASRDRPFSREQELRTQLIGYPPNVHELLEAARREDPYR